MFEIDGLKPMARVNDGVKMFVKNPDNTPAVRADKEPLWILVRSFYSAATREAQHRVQDKRFAEARSGLQNTASAASIEQDQIDNLCSVTVEWNFQTADGTAIPCTHETAAKLYADPRFAALKQQVFAFANENANFIAA